MSDIGHNSSVNSATAKRLLSIIERIEALEAERKNLGEALGQLADTPLGKAATERF